MKKLKRIMLAVPLLAGAVVAHATVVGTFPQSYMPAQITDESCASNPATRGMTGHVAIVRDEGQDHFGCWIHKHVEAPYGTLSVTWTGDPTAYELPWGMVRDPLDTNKMSKW